MLVFNDSSVIVNQDMPDAQTVITRLAEKLHLQGLVSSDYGNQTWARELKHPTGLPTNPFPIAFPHADADGVNQSSLAVAILKNTVKFKNMADPDEELEVSIVLMLANKSPEEQIQTLRNLALLFGQPEKLTELQTQNTEQAVVTWLKNELHLE